MSTRHLTTKRYPMSQARAERVARRAALYEWRTGRSASSRSRVTRLLDWLADWL